AVIVSHNDTGHRHVHLMVNRVHPDKARAHNVWRDRTRMKNILGRIEKDRGYQRVSAGREWGGKEQRKARSKGEFMRLRKQGFEKMPLADKVEFFDVNETIKTADNWRELQARLGKIDLHIIAKGRGGALEDTRTGKTYKLSRVGREHSFGKLQRRFGKLKEYQRSLEISREAGRSIPGREIGAATARLIEEGWRGRTISKDAKTQFEKAIRCGYDAQKSIAKIGKMASNLRSRIPQLSPLKYAYKARKGIIKQIEREQNRGRGLSRKWGRKQKDIRSWTEQSGSGNSNYSRKRRRLSPAILPT